jgi:hypothetical protein
MKPWTPSDAQIAQLELLRKHGALSADTAVGPRAGGQRNVKVNSVMLGTALAPKGLVVPVKKKAQYGEPAMTLYWITTDGLKVLERSGR